MRRSKLITTAIVSFMLISTSCSDDPVVPVDEKFVRNFQGNDWKLTDVWDKSNNYGAEYTDYRFDFYESGLIQVRKTGSATLSGNWVHKIENDKSRVTLTVQGGLPVSRVNHDWRVS